MRQLRGYAMAGQPTTFLTLTSNPHHGADATARAKTLVNGWRILAKRIKRKFKWKRLDYLVVVEHTKRGEPHLHVLLRCKYIPQKWLATQWEELTGARVVDIRKITDQRGASRYVSKYVSKSPARFGKLKRYWATQTWRTAPKPKPSANPWCGVELRTTTVDMAQVLVQWLRDGHKLLTSSLDYIEVELPAGTGPPSYCV